MTQKRGECNREIAVERSIRSAVVGMIELTWMCGYPAWLERKRFGDGPPMPLTTEQLLAKLKSDGYETRTIRHAPMYTVADSRRLRGDLQGRHTKNLFLKDKKDNFFLITLGEDRDVDLKQLHKHIGAASRLSFGKPDKLMQYLGIAPGAVSALAVVNDVDGKVNAFLDEELMDHALINAHPLTNEATTTIKTTDLVDFMKRTGHPPAIRHLSF